MKFFRLNVLLIFLLLTFSSAITSADYIPRINTNYFSIELQDIIFIFIFIFILIKFRKNNFHYDLDSLMRIYALICLLSFIFSILRGSLLINAIRQFIIAINSLFFYYIVIFIKNKYKKADEIIIKRILLVALISSVIIMLQYIFISKGLNIYIVNKDFIKERLSGIYSIRTPAQDLLLVSTLLIISYHFLEKRLKIINLGRLNIFYSVIVLIGFFLQLARHQFVALVIFFLFIIISNISKLRFKTIIFLLLFVLILSIYIIMPYNDELKEWYLGYLKKDYYDLSIEHRKIEYKYAIESLIKNPFLGVGLGGNYRPFGSIFDDLYYDVNKTYDYVGTYYIHNALLWWAVDTGIIGIIFIIIIFIKIYKKIKNNNINYIISLIIFSYMIASLGAPMWMASTSSSAILGILLGLVSEIKKRNNEEQQIYENTY